MRNTGNNPVVVLFMCHSLHEESLKEFDNIQKAVEGFADASLLFHQTDGAGYMVSTNKCIHTFTNEDLYSLEYRRIGPAVVPGNAHFPLLHFFRRNPDYEYYWVIEYDVRFAGDWRMFFESCLDDNSDFMTCHIRRQKDEPKWYWWWLDHPEKHISLCDRIRSFNPIYRISKGALKHLNGCLNDGWCAHFEVLIPTLLFHGGFRLADFGGTGEFVPPGRENKFYIDSLEEETGNLYTGTVRWRPLFTRVGTEEDKLYHPVKPFHQS